MKINTFREDTISRTTKRNYKRDSLKLKRSCKVKWSSLRNKRESTDDTFNILCEKRKRVAWQNVLMSFRATQFTSAIDLLKAVNFCWLSLDFWCEGKKWCTLSGQEITQHGKELQGILPLQLVNSVRNRLVRIFFVRKPTKPIEWNLYLSILKLHCMKRASAVSALSTICSTGKIVYIQIIRTDLWSFQAHQPVHS